MIEVIGLHGGLESGKDTTFSMIEKVAQRPVKRDAFADRLKQSAAAALGYRGDNPVGFCNWLKEESQYISITSDNPDAIPEWLSEEMAYRWVFSGREYLQWYGTEAHRQVFDPDFWINAVLPEPELETLGRDDLESNTLLVITDVRFPNEAEAVRRAGGEVWEVDASKRKPRDESHASEKRLPDGLIDYVLDNNGTLEDLERRVKYALESRVFLLP